MPARVKHDDRVVAWGTRVHRVVDVNEALGVDLDTMAVAVADPSGKVAPVVMDFVGPFAGFDDG